MKAEQYKSVLDQIKGKRSALNDELDRYESIRLKAKRALKGWLRAKALIVETGLQTQMQLQYQISNLTTLAMQSVFDDPYEVQIEFVPRRGKTECDIWFVRDGKRRDPLDSSGFGACDIASFALRVSALSMNKDNLRKVLVLDEPWKHIKGIDTNRKAIQMMKEVSDKLGVQIITIADERVPMEEIENGADKIFHVRIKDRESSFRQVHL